MYYAIQCMLLLFICKCAGAAMCIGVKRNELIDTIYHMKIYLLHKYNNCIFQE